MKYAVYFQLQFTQLIGCPQKDQILFTRVFTMESWKGLTEVKPLVGCVCGDFGPHKVDFFEKPSLVLRSYKKG